MKFKIEVRLYDGSGNKEKFIIWIDGDPFQGLKKVREKITKLFEEPK